MDTGLNNANSLTKQKESLARLERFSRITDNSFRIPFTSIRFGIEAIIGLVPVVGDLIGLILACYVLLEAQRAGADKAVKFKIARNMAIDFVGGLLPVVGDAFDVLFKANTRNTALLKHYLEAQISPESAEPPFPWRAFVGLSTLLAIAALGFTALP